MTNFEDARDLIRGFKGDRYRHGFDLLQEAGTMAAGLGRRAVVVRETFPGAEVGVEAIAGSLRAAGIEVAGVVPGAAPNAPREDVVRILGSLEALAPDFAVSFGGGSTIDAVKAALTLRAFGGDIEEYFGTGLVTAKAAATGRRPAPHLAIQTASSSSAHLTKYSNITDLQAGQKKLIVDDAIVPDRAIYDYGVSASSPAALTADGALDGLSHCLEVLYGAVGKPQYGLIERVARTGIGLVLEWLPRVLAEPAGRQGREALGLATDLGGYAIMLGGTNGAHLTSFSLIDILSHGRACIMLNPYYTVFFSPAVQEPLRLVDGLGDGRGAGREGRALGEAVAQSLMDFERRVGVPVRLADVPGFTEGHIERALKAAKNPQLRMKLENMPVPLKPETVDEYMGPVLRAATTGDLSGIKTA
jgi:alcohol dehydrogenase